MMYQKQDVVLLQSISHSTGSMRHSLRLEMKCFVSINNGSNYHFQFLLAYDIIQVLFDFVNLLFTITICYLGRVYLQIILYV